MRELKEERINLQCEEVSLVTGFMPEKRAEEEEADIRVEPYLLFTTTAGKMDHTENLQGHRSQIQNFCKTQEPKKGR